MNVESPVSLRARLARAGRRGLLGLGLGMITLAILFLGLEIGLRLSGPGRRHAEDGGHRGTDRIDPNSPRYLPSASWGWTLAPDTVHTFRSAAFDTRVTANDLGLRGNDVREEGPGVVRWVVLGDSYAFGWGVNDDQTYPAQLQHLLNEHARSGSGRTSLADSVRFEILDGALPGFGTEQRARVFESLLPYGIDGVILEFSVANDVADDWRIAPYLPDHLADYHRELQRIDGSEIRRFSAFERWLDRHSRAVHWLRRRTLYPRMWVLSRAPSNLARTRSLLEDLIGRCRAQGLPVVLLLNPARSQVQGGGEGGRWRILQGYSRRPNVMVRRLAAELDVPLVDGESVFRAADVSRVYLTGDPHWTAYGNARIAAALAPYVEDLARR
jgi:hypothetical protein